MYFLFENVMSGYVIKIKENLVLNSSVIITETNNWITT